MSKKLNELLKPIAEKQGVALKEAKSELMEWWKASFPDAYEEVDGKLEDADEDYIEWIVDAWDTRISRASFSGGGKGEEYVGMFVAYVSRRDSREEQTKLAQSSAAMDLQHTLANGIKPYKNRQDITVPVCRAFYQDGSWKAVNSQDQVIHTQEGEEVSPPDWAIPVPGKKFYVCMITQKGVPMDKESFERTWLFVGNTPDKLLSEGPLEMPLSLKCRWDAGSSILRLNVPVRFKAEMWERDDRKGLSTGDISPDYTLDWADEEHRDALKSLFNPQLYLSKFVPHVADLTEVFDYHEEHSWQSSYGNQVGPTFSIKGTVEYIDYVGRELDWVEGGTQYSLRISSNSLKREDANGAIYVNVTKHLDDFHNAFQVEKGGEWLPYTTGTQVIIVGKSRTYQKDNGDINLSMDAYNIYAIPSRAFIGETPDEDDSDMGTLGGFRSD